MLWFHSSGSAFSMLLVRSGRAERLPQDTDTITQSKKVFRRPVQDCTLSLIYLFWFSECILCWSSCRGFIVRRLRRGYVGSPLSLYDVQCRCPLAKLTNPRYKLWIRIRLMRIRIRRILIFVWCGSGCGSGFDFSPWCGSGSRSRSQLPNKGSDPWKSAKIGS